MAKDDIATHILKTYLTLLCEEGYEAVNLARLAEKAEISLSTLRDHFGSRLALLQGFGTMIDRQVLNERDADMADQPARDRLFDVLMTRLDALGPYKQGIRALMASVRRDPALALEVNCIALRSQGWMLTAAGINFTGLRGRLVTQGLAISFAKVLATWIEDTDPGIARTMAKLDRELDKGEDWLSRLDKAEKMASKARKLACRLQKAGNRFNRRRRNDWAQDVDMGTVVSGDGDPAPAT